MCGRRGCWGERTKLPSGCRWLRLSERRRCIVASWLLERRWRRRRGLTRAAIANHGPLARLRFIWRTPGIRRSGSTPRIGPDGRADRRRPGVRGTYVARCRAAMMHAPACCVPHAAYRCALCCMPRASPVDVAWYMHGTCLAWCMLAAVCCGLHSTRAYCACCIGGKQMTATTGQQRWSAKRAP